ncbi:MULTISPECIES: hypothetical protein [unclassified Microbacterium]|uniref:hypothetical protein n=1 Tax=unclassified Microbacterium TaxID=2609290 RepID=UPI00214BC45E|nr:MULTISPECIES: hypothetical protein [unclassified Microbacterium]MCR2785441.1 hypothetical protein [Microbacterium sp. zg.B96]WIM14532.1 hypothetical protein QNO11_08055 [Microbacterium sp. zg-B96]
MAIGDDAVAAGMAAMTGGEDADTLDTEMNKTRDYIAQRTKRTSPNLDFWVQSAAPAHADYRVWIKVMP